MAPVRAAGWQGWQLESQGWGTSSLWLCDISRLSFSGCKQRVRGAKGRARPPGKSCAAWGLGGPGAAHFSGRVERRFAPGHPQDPEPPKGRPLEVPAPLSAAHHATTAPPPLRPCLLPLYFQSLLQSQQPPPGPSDTPGTSWPQGLCTGCSLGPESSVPGGRGVLLLRALGCLLSCTLQRGLCVPVCPQLKTLCSLFPAPVLFFS